LSLGFQVLSTAHVPPCDCAIGWRTDVNRVRIMFCA